MSGLRLQSFLSHSKVIGFYFLERENSQEFKNKDVMISLSAKEESIETCRIN